MGQAPRVSGQAVLVVSITKSLDDQRLPRGRIEAGDSREGDAVEGRIFNKSIMRHVQKHEPLPDLQGLGEGVISDDVAGQAGDAAQAVGVREFARQVGTDDVRSVRHLQGVRHVVGRRDVDDRDVDAVMDQVEDRADQDAGADADGFAGLHVNLQVIAPALAEGGEHADETLDVVALARDMMPAAEVDPFHLGNEFAKLMFKGGDGALEDVGPLLAHRVEVETFQAVEVGGGFDFGA